MSVTRNVNKKTWMTANEIQVSAALWHVA